MTMHHHPVSSGEMDEHLVPVSVPRVDASSVHRTYRNEHLSNLSPVQVVQKLYDIAILGCKKQQYGLAQRAVTELMMALNFEHRELALGLFRLYDYVKHCIRKNEVHEAIAVLEELRATWTKAFGLEKSK